VKARARPSPQETGPARIEMELALPALARRPSRGELEVLQAVVQAVLGVVPALAPPGGAWRFAGRPWRRPEGPVSPSRNVFNYGGEPVDK